MEEKGGGEKALFSQVAQITHRHKKVTNAIHERMHHKHQHLFILNFFFSKWQKTQLTGFTFVNLLLTLHI